MKSIEIEKRRNNIVLHGVCEKVQTSITNLGDLLDKVFTKTPDQELVEEILKEGLKIDASRHIEEVQRIGRYVAGKIVLSEFASGLLKPVMKFSSVLTTSKIAMNTRKYTLHLILPESSNSWIRI